MPFLLAEHRLRVASQKTLLGRADASLPAKYRRLREVYRMEVNYGHSTYPYREAPGRAGGAHNFYVLAVKLGLRLHGLACHGRRDDGRWYRCRLNS